MDINKTSNIIHYLRYVEKYPGETNSDRLICLGVESTSNIQFPLASQHNSLKCVMGKALCEIY
jgi:hypothetical protein